MRIVGECIVINLREGMHRDVIVCWVVRVGRAARRLDRRKQTERESVLTKGLSREESLNDAVGENGTGASFENFGTGRGVTSEDDDL